MGIGLYILYSRVYHETNNLQNRRILLKAYFLTAHPADGIFTLVMEGVVDKSGRIDTNYYPFKSRSDLDMALEVAKDAGVEIEID